MYKEIKKGFLTSLGAVLLSKDKIEEVVRKMVDESKITEADARRLKDELLNTGEQQFSKMENAFSEALKKGLDRLGISREEEFYRLKHKVEALEVRLSIVEKTIAEKPKPTPGKEE